MIILVLTAARDVGKGLDVAGKVGLDHLEGHFDHILSGYGQDEAVGLTANGDVLFPESGFELVFDEVGLILSDARMDGDIDKMLDQFLFRSNRDFVHSSPVLGPFLVVFATLFSGARSSLTCGSCGLRS